MGPIMGMNHGQENENVKSHGNSHGEPDAKAARKARRGRTASSGRARRLTTWVSTKKRLGSNLSNIIGKIGILGRFKGKIFGILEWGSYCET